uniref:Uncharacterized protein n=1 Tax=Arundo donax TaxID=35708 RepID=A0A0A9FVD8_ARUDO
MAAAARRSLKLFSEVMVSESLRVTGLGPRKILSTGRGFPISRTNCCHLGGMSGQFKSPMATRRFFADCSDHKDTDVSNVLKDITETQSGLSKNFPKDENQDPNNSENVDHELLDVLKQMNKANTGISKYLNGLMNSKDPDHEIVKVLKEMSSANTRIYEFLNARKNSFTVDNEATEAPKELIKTSGRSCENLKKIAAGVNRVISLSEDSLAVNKLNKGYLMEIRDYLRS